jgi:hypothetical protein
MIPLQRLHVDEQTLREFDTLAHHFSCAQPDLRSDTLEILRADMKRELSKTWDWAEQCRIAAYCRSFAELQLLAEVCNEVSKIKGRNLLL